MKIYEKPMAIIETIDVEDVITASTTIENADVASALKSATGMTEDDNLILFQW